MQFLSTLCHFAKKVLNNFALSRKSRLEAEAAATSKCDRSMCKSLGLNVGQVDSVHYVVSGMDSKTVVAETGWPSHDDCDEVGPSVENAKAYNGNLITHLRSLAGTPLMPGKSGKPGPRSECAFGLFKTDLNVAYDAGINMSSQKENNQDFVDEEGELLDVMTWTCKMK